MSVKSNPSTTFHASGSNSSETMPSSSLGRRWPPPFKRLSDKTKFIVATGVTVVLSALPTLLAGYILNGNGQQLAVADALAATVASITYSAMFLLLGTGTRHAVIVGLVYALVWESLFGSLVGGARDLSVQQWSLALAQKIADNGAVTSEVGLPAAVVLLLAVTVAATWYAGRKLRTLTLAGEE